MTAERRPKVFSSLGLVDGRRRAPKPCFVSLPVKRRRRKKENHSAGYKPKEPSDYPATAHFVSDLKRNETQRREKRKRRETWRHLITWSTHVLVLQPWHQRRVGSVVSSWTSGALHFSQYNSTSNFTQSTASRLHTYMSVYLKLRKLFSSFLWPIVIKCTQQVKMNTHAPAIF